MNLDTYKKKLYITSKRRGMIELDHLLGFIADNYLHTMNKEQLILFENFLQLNDKILFESIINKNPVDKKYIPIYNLLENFTYK